MLGLAEVAARDARRDLLLEREGVHERQEGERDRVLAREALGVEDLRARRRRRRGDAGCAGAVAEPARRVGRRLGRGEEEGRAAQVGPDDAGERGEEGGDEAEERANEGGGRWAVEVGREGPLEDAEQDLDEAVARRGRVGRLGEAPGRGREVVDEGDGERVVVVERDAQDVEDGRHVLVVLVLAVPLHREAVRLRLLAPEHVPPRARARARRSSCSPLAAGVVLEDVGKEAPG